MENGIGTLKVSNGIIVAIAKSEAPTADCREIDGKFFGSIVDFSGLEIHSASVGLPTRDAALKEMNKLISLAQQPAV